MKTKESLEMEQIKRVGAESGLMSVTELARQVGVSIRTIQYYDQMGLLSPSAKGPNNQRLYTEQERTRLYRILVLKYLGYSLKEIREGAGPQSVEEIRPHLAAALDKLEPEFLDLFRRMTTLRKMAGFSPEHAGWKGLARIIDTEDNNGPLFWQAMSIQDQQPVHGSKSGMNREEAQQWHTLCRETMGLMQSGISPTSPQARLLAKRFRAMGGTERAREGINLMVMSMGSHGSTSSPVPESLIDSIIAYLSGDTASPEAAGHPGHPGHPGEAGHPSHHEALQ